MARILAISSQVARGAVGLSVAVPALQALGHEVIALPTILLSSHPGHAHVVGERVAPGLLRRMLDTLDGNGWLAGVDALLTGYLPSAGHVAFAVEAAERLRQRNARLRFLCDPVLGDEPKGVYIEAAAAEALRSRLVPFADALKMNRFELAWLTERPIGSAEDAVAAVAAQGWGEVVVTSVPMPDAGTIGNILCEAGVASGIESVTRHARAPNGTGDLMAALYLGHSLRPGVSRRMALARAAVGLAAVISASHDADELQIARMLGELRI